MNLTVKWAAADEAFGRGQQAYLDWCKAIAKLYAEGDATQEEIAERYGKSQPMIANHIAVGQDKRIIYSINSLPKSTKVLYELTTLPDKDFEELCKPTTTQKIILAYKNRLAPPKKTSAEINAMSADLGAKLDEKRAKQHASFDKALESLTSTLKAKAPQPVLGDISAIEFLAQAFENMLYHGGASAAKLAKQMFSAAYHPDGGKIEQNAELMGSINKAISSLED